VGNILQVKVKEIDGTQKIEIIGEFKIHISDANLTELLKHGVHLGNISV
jgi:urease accessory protein UreE